MNGSAAARRVVRNLCWSGSCTYGLHRPDESYQPVLSPYPWMMSSATCRGATITRESIEEIGSQSASNSHMYLGSHLFEGPQFPRKGLLKAPWSPQAKKWLVLSATHRLGSRLSQFPTKGFQKAPGRPKPKSGKFYQQLTYWEAACLKVPKSRQKASQRPLVAPSQKVASFISNSHIGKPLF